MLYPDSKEISLVLTYEGMTEIFLKAAASLSLVVHPEYLLNTRTLEREFVCTCHAGSCEEAELHSSCTVSFSWGHWIPLFPWKGQPVSATFSMRQSRIACIYAPAQFRRWCSTCPIPLRSTA